MKPVAPHTVTPGSSYHHPRHVVAGILAQDALLLDRVEGRERRHVHRGDLVDVQRERRQRRG